MNCVKKNIALLGVVLLLAPAGYGQSRSNRGPQLSSEGGFMNNITKKYNPQYVPPIDITNSTRIEQLVRAGNLYLSIQDTIALALENNIGLEIQRYNFQTNNVALLNSYTNNGQWDPTFTSQNNWGRNAQISTNAVQAGGQNVNVTNSMNNNFGVQQNFSTGTQAQLTFNNGVQNSNNLNTNFVPQYNSTLQAQITQPLLRGFGSLVNKQGIYIAKNNIRAFDYTFQQQINTTINTVVQAYWNLVNAVQSVGVARQALDLSQKLMDQNKIQVQIGTMAPIDLRQTEQQVAQNEQALVRAEGTVLTTEVSLKNQISRNGIENATLSAVHIIPTSSAEVPTIEPVQPLQDLVDSAIKNRPELSAQRIQLENTDIQLKVLRNQMLPQINLTGNLSNQGAGGIPNTKPNVNAAGQVIPRQAPAPEFIGGYPNILRQVWLVPTINYTIGFNISIPLRNRTQQYAMATQELQKRTQQLQLQQQLNQIRADVNTAQIAIQNARAQYAAAEKALAAQEAVVDAEQRKFQLGTSTLYIVTQQLNTLATSRQNKVTAQIAYATAKLQLDVATGNLMDKYDIVLDEAKDGSLSRRSDPIPDQINQQQQAARPGTPAGATAAR